MTLDALLSFVEGEAVERIFATGGQLYVSVDGVPVVDAAVGVDGVDKDVHPDTLFAVYCAAKPAFVLALAALVEDEELSFDDRLGDVVDRMLPRELSSLEVGQLLSHTAGLHLLDGHSYMTATPALREAMALANEPPHGWRPGVDVAYSEAGAWHLLAAAVEDLTGEEVRAVVKRRVLDPAGLDADMFVAGMTDAEYDEHRDRLGVNVYLTGRDVDPILSEQTRRTRCLPSPALGNTANARGLGRFYEAFLAMLDRDVVTEIITTRARGFDPVMGRTCSYGYGLMTELRGHDFGRTVGRTAFGHSGYSGMTAAFADPAHGLVVAFHFNGRVDAESSVSYRRPALIDHVYRSVLGVDREAEDPARA